MTAWRAPKSRPTMDIDLLGQTSNDLEYLRLAVQEICCSRVEPDGVEFSVETLEIQKIKEDAEYEGARVRLLATSIFSVVVAQVAQLNFLRVAT